jgi:uncharacterized membrane protein/glutaredoxin
MRKTLILLSLIVMLAGTPMRAKAAPMASEQPVVNAVMFYMNGCPYCKEALTTTLPPVQDKYSSQFNLLLIELVTSQDIDNLYVMGASLGFSKEQVAVPFLLIDQTALIGVDEISSKLTGLIDKYLAAGGLGYPNMPILGEMLPKGIAFTAFESDAELFPQPAAQSNATGMTLAWVIMAIMGMAIIGAIVMILRAFQGKPIREFKGWQNITIPILTVIGLGASIYLTYVEITHTRALCGPVGDCNAVQSSPYAKLFGILPIGLLGAFGYVGILVAWAWQHYRNDALSKIAGPAMYGMALFGTLFSVYLTYLELFVIHAVCIWCLSSAVIITALMLLNLPSITQWLAISEEEE